MLKRHIEANGYRLIRQCLWGGFVLFPFGARYQSIPDENFYANRKSTVLTLMILKLFSGYLLLTTRKASR